jgi:hypothetical protein
MSGPGEIARWPAKLRLSEIRRRGTGELDPIKMQEAKERLVGSIVADTWHKNGNYVHPMVKIFVDEHYIYCSLLAMEEEPWLAAVWRNERFDTVKFQRNLEQAIATGLHNYRTQARDVGILLVDDKQPALVPIDRLGDPLPRRI